MRTIRGSKAATGDGSRLYFRASGPFIAGNSMKTLLLLLFTTLPAWGQETLDHTSSSLTGAADLAQALSPNEAKQLVTAAAGTWAAPQQVSAPQPDLKEGLTAVVLLCGIVLVLKAGTTSRQSGRVDWRG